MRIGTYFASSALAAIVVIWHAFATREQFFPSMVYLTNSKLSVAILGNFGFASALGVYKFLTWVFLGRLRDSEIERINDKVSQAVIETLLAMTIFRQDFTVGFFAAFVILSFVKIFHWMVQDRVDFIETTPNVTRSQHIRIVSFILLLVSIDYLLLHHALATTLAHGVSIHLLFAFEYAIQASTAIATLAKYCLSIADMAMEGRWEGKGVAVFYLELALDLLQLITYSAFFAAVFTTYGIPIHLVRDLYWTFRNFQTRVRDFLRYRRVAANMERRFPDASAEDLERADHVCIVCREEMGPGSRAKKLMCNHTFHLHCLRSWLERQQNCPICRAPVLATRPSVVPNVVPVPVPGEGGGGEGGGAAAAERENGEDGAAVGGDDVDFAQLVAALLREDAHRRRDHHHDRNGNNIINEGVGGAGPAIDQVDGGGGGDGGGGRRRITPQQQELRRRRQQQIDEIREQMRTVTALHQERENTTPAAQYQQQHYQQQQPQYFAALPHLQQQQQGMLPFMQIPVFIPLMMPPPPPQQQQQPPAAAAAPTTAPGEQPNQQSSPSPLQQPTAEQHAMASAIAAAAASAAMMALPFYQTSVVLPQQAQQEESEVGVVGNDTTTSGTGIEGVHVEEEHHHHQPFPTAATTVLPVDAPNGSSSTTTTTPIEEAAAGPSTSTPTAVAAAASSSNTTTTTSDDAAEEIRKQRLKRFLPSSSSLS